MKTIKEQLEELKTNKSSLNAEDLITPCSASTLKVAKTYIILFVYKTGNGWAIVTAPSGPHAEVKFKQQTKFKDAIITGTRETKWIGDNTLIIFEGAVTTYNNNVDVSISLSDLINASDAFDSVEEYLNTVLNLDKYYTKEQLDLSLPERVRQVLQSMGSDILNVNLSDYVKKTEMQEVVLSAISNLHIESGKDGATPEIDEITYHWTINGIDTGVVAKGENGINGTNGKDGKDGKNGINGLNGVGINNIEYVQSTVSGGKNKLSIILTDGTVCGPYTIKNGIDGQNSTTPQGPSEGNTIIDIAKGSFEYALEIASENSDTYFQFILEAEDINQNPIIKPIWHIGNNTFIDAFGTEIS